MDLKINLNQIEYYYLQGASFIPEEFKSGLYLTLQGIDRYPMVISKQDIGIIRNLCKKQFDEVKGETSEDAFSERLILKHLIRTLTLSKSWLHDAFAVLVGNLMKRK